MTGEQTDRQTDGEADRHTNRQSYFHGQFVRFFSYDSLIIVKNATKNDKIIKNNREKREIVNIFMFSCKIQKYLKKC